MWSAKDGFGGQLFCKHERGLELWVGEGAILDWRSVKEKKKKKNFRDTEGSAKGIWMHGGLIRRVSFAV